jgi:anti-anti-sigma regulatory factor
MPTQIFQIDDPDSNLTVLRISGSLLEADAELIERISIELVKEDNRTVTLDLAGLDFLDSDGASILARLKATHGVESEGVHRLIQAAIDEAEKNTTKP